MLAVEQPPCAQERWLRMNPQPCSPIPEDPNIIEHSASFIGVKARLNKLKFQCGGILGRHAPIAVRGKNDLGRPRIVKNSHVGIVQVCTGGANGQMNRTALVARTAVQAIATAKCVNARVGEREIIIGNVE